MPNVSLSNNYILSKRYQDPFQEVMRHTNHHIFLNKTTILNVTKKKLALHGHATQCAVNEWQSMQYLTESSPLYTNNTIKDVSWYPILIETHTF